MFRRTQPSEFSAHIREVQRDEEPLGRGKCLSVPEFASLQVSAKAARASAELKKSRGGLGRAVVFFSSAHDLQPPPYLRGIPGSILQSH